jgi:acetyltransferase-like isoleucine patch superfamily enzyme
MRAALRVSVFKTLYLSARYRGQIIIFRGTRVQLKRGARIRIARGARLSLGGSELTATRCSLTIRRNASLIINGDVKVNRGTRILVDNNARLEIGHESKIHCDSIVTCMEQITIGSGCIISWNVNIIDGSAHELIVGGVPRPRTRPVHIGDKVWIGTGAIVIGATVGDGSVLAAGSVVTSEVPAKTVVGGNPARVIREDVAWRF